jgi:hypothetical protein
MVIRNPENGRSNRTGSNADARNRTATDQLASACLLTPKDPTDGSEEGPRSVLAGR